MNLSDLVASYGKHRTFDSEDSAQLVLKTAFLKRKVLYFDEVENANVWSFYLVDRDLHHVFEDWVRSLYSVPYALWSGVVRSNACDDDIGRATFPIADTATSYRKPVPRAGDELLYFMEALEIGYNSATLGFLGYLNSREQGQTWRPSVRAVWNRVFVQYSGDDRAPAGLPSSLQDHLQALQPKDGSDILKFVAAKAAEPLEAYRDDPERHH